MELRVPKLSCMRTERIPLGQGSFTLLDVYGADEAFVTGTFDGVTPVRTVGGRSLGTVPGPLTARLVSLYAALLERRDGACERAPSATATNQPAISR